ncbi:MAG TPA: YciI family protein [Steroidobacteraceae bacterium]
MNDDRRHFVFAGLSAVLAGSAVAESDDPAQPSFLCVYRPGANWLPGKPLAEQPLREHGRYMLDLYRRGIMRLAGRFADGSGGAMLFGAPDDASAQAIVAADPAVAAQTFTYELRQWAFVDWEALAKRPRG